VADNFSAGNVNLDSIIDLDAASIRKTDSASIMSTNARDNSSSSSGQRVGSNGRLLGEFRSLDSAKLELGLLRVDLVKNESALVIIEKTKGHIGLGDGDDIIEASRVVQIRTGLAINKNLSSHDDHHSLTTSQRELQSVAENEGERETFSELVRTSGRTRSPCSTELSKHPVLGGIEALEMFLGTTSHLG